MFSDDAIPEKAMPDSSDSEVADAPPCNVLTKQQQFGDAGPLGLSAFGFTTFVMALFNLSAGGVGVPNLIIGPGLIYGGLGQLLAGMWDMASGKTVSATISSAYGCFWMSFAVILIPGFGVREAYNNDADYYKANGFFMLGFFVFSLAVTMVSMKGTYPFLTLTILVNFTWLFLSIANLKTDENGQPDEVFKKMGGAFGLLVAFTAWYNMYAGLANDTNSFFVAPQPQIIRKRKL
ncbi:hypothetical protein LIA77_01370 [Sarocladium implicatum]|nr:hypothetical protein LIA77_01370 [Sarocladium implicatum]